MAKYVDGFVLVVPKDKVEEYTKMATEGRDSWMKHGALQYFECKGDDLKADEMGDMKSLAFTELAKASADETVWFSFIVFESRAHRDEVNKKVPYTKIIWVGSTKTSKTLKTYLQTFNTSAK